MIFFVYPVPTLLRLSYTKAKRGAKKIRLYLDKYIAFMISKAQNYWLIL